MLRVFRARYKGVLKEGGNAEDRKVFVLCLSNHNSEVETHTTRGGRRYGGSTYYIGLMVTINVL